MSKRIDQLLLLGATLILVLMFVMQNVSKSGEASRNPSSGSNSASGVSVFYDLKNALEHESAFSGRRAFFSANDLAPYKSLYLLAPKLPLTEKENDLVMNWVRAGGKLVVSFQDEETLKRIQPFLAAANIIANVVDVPNFQQGLGIATEAKTSHAFFQAGEKYEFYSRLRFGDHECFQDATDCFIREGILDKGGVVAIAGLVPFSNALISRADNARLASRIAVATGRSQFADYHLFENEKTFRDFLLDPAIWLPMVGLLIGIFLFFFAGAGDYEEQRLRAEKRKPARSFHALNRQILKTVMDQPGSLEAAGIKQAAYIKRLIGDSLSPHERETLGKITTALIAAGDRTNHLARGADRDAAPLVHRLISFHQNWLKSRGRSE